MNGINFPTVAGLFKITFGIALNGNTDLKFKLYFIFIYLIALYYLLGGASYDFG